MVVLFIGKKGSLSLLEKKGMGGCLWLASFNQFLVHRRIKLLSKLCLSIGYSLFGFFHSLPKSRPILAELKMESRSWN